MDETSPTCEACRVIYGNKSPVEDPPCNSCRPVLEEDSRGIVDVYFMTRGQIITAGMGTVVDINIPAVKIVMDLLGVEDQKECLTEVRRLFHEFKPKEE